MTQNIPFSASSKMAWFGIIVSGHLFCILIRWHWFSPGAEHSSSLWLAVAYHKDCRVEDHLPYMPENYQIDKKRKDKNDKEQTWNKQLTQRNKWAKYDESKRFVPLD